MVDFRGSNVSTCKNKSTSVKKGIQSTVREGEVGSVFKALVLGTRDYAKKMWIQKAVIGLSGGIDSAVTAVIAAKALGRGKVFGVTMPSSFSSRGSVEGFKGIG